MVALRTIGKSVGRLGRPDIHFYVARPQRNKPPLHAQLCLKSSEDFGTKANVQVQPIGRDDQESRIEIGFAIAPVPLNLEGKNRALVGLGSYLVNAAMSCNDCHDAGPQTQFVPGRNPFFGQPNKIDPAFYLGGGRDFGPLVPTPGSRHIVSRNLTPDRTGLPGKGRSFSEFLQIIKTGVDLDHLHPPCSANVTTNCLPLPFDGNL